MTASRAVLQAQTSEKVPLLQVSGLSKRYGDQYALADVSFAVHGQQVLGLIGPNGAGKTTLLEAIAGVLPARRWPGSYGKARLSQARRRDLIFYLPDGLRPWDDQFVNRIVDFFATVYRRSRGDVLEVIRSVGLLPVLNKRINALSKGYNRRLMLALALLTPQPFLLMDEPFDGFDLRQTREIMGVLRRTSGAGPHARSCHPSTDRRRAHVRPFRAARGWPDPGRGDA